LDTSIPREAANTIKEHLGSLSLKLIVKNPVLDILVLNAGISQRDIFERMSIDTAEKIMNINFMSYVTIAKV
jgi:short-subunit dehydrogenase